MPTFSRPTLIVFATALLAGHVPGRAAASAPLPAITFSTYLGGPGDDRALAVATDAAGNSYVAGQSTRGGDVRYGFVAKYSPAGALLYVNFLGNGHCNTWATGIAVDAQGSAVVTGAYGYEDQWGYCNNRGVLAARLTPDGSAFVYAWNFGGVGGNDAGNAVAVDSAGNAYITGKMFATLTTTPGAFQKDPAGWEDAFVLKLDPAGATLYATYLGGSWKEEGLAIAVDDGGRAHVCGSVSSTDFPVTAGALQGAHPNGTASAFVTVLDPAGSRILYSTYLGGGLGENASGIAVDPAGLVYVTGSTNSENFPTTPNAFDRTCGSDGSCNPFNDGAHHWFEDAFLVQIDPRKQGAASLLYSTFFGGGVRDLGRAVAVDAQGRVWVVGATNSAQDFPGSGALQDGVRGDYDAFIAAFDLTRGGADSLLFDTGRRRGLRRRLGGRRRCRRQPRARGVYRFDGLPGGQPFAVEERRRLRHLCDADLHGARARRRCRAHYRAGHGRRRGGAHRNGHSLGTGAGARSVRAVNVVERRRCGHAGVGRGPGRGDHGELRHPHAYGRRDDQCDRLGSVRRHHPGCVLHAGAAGCAVSLAEAGRDCAGRVQHGNRRADRASARGRSMVSIVVSDPKAISVPATVTVAAGQSSAQWTVTSTGGAAAVAITASCAGAAKSATLTIGATAAALASVTLNPSILILKTAGTGQVTLTGPAPAGGAVVALAVSEPMEVELPSSVTVPAGQLHGDVSGGRYSIRNRRTVGDFGDLPERHEDCRPYARRDRDRYAHARPHFDARGQPGNRDRHSDRRGARRHAGPDPQFVLRGGGSAGADDTCREHEGDVLHRDEDRSLADRRQHHGFGQRRSRRSRRRCAST